MSYERAPQNKVGHDCFKGLNEIRTYNIFKLDITLRYRYEENLIIFYYPKTKRKFGLTSCFPANPNLS